MTMASELEAALADARAAAEDLEQLDDSISALIPEVEEALRGLRLGVRLHVCMEEGQWHKSLVFDKHAGAWRLLIAQGPDPALADPDDWKETPLASAPRDERALVFGHYLRELVLSAGEQLKAKASERRRAIEATSTVVESLRKARAQKARS